MDEQQQEQEQVEEFPFSVGQLVESKSNIKGFRGAWFRSQIKNIQIRRGEVWCAMHYIDFPDEKTNFMKAYQHESSGKKKRVLMVRPSFPLISVDFVDSVIKDANGPVVVINGGWWVGDLVDWFTDGCFWTAKITAVISKEIVRIELPSAPLGEGGSYEAAIKDIRPTLDWTMDQFWTVPTEKILPHDIKAHIVDGPSDSFSSPVETFQNLNTHHIFIARQEAAKVPGVQDLNNTSDVHDKAQLKGKSMDGDSHFEKFRVFDAKANDNLVTAIHHGCTVSGNIAVRAGQDSAMMSLDVHKDETDGRAWVTGQKHGPLDFPSTGLLAASKQSPSQRLQQLQFGTSDDDWVGSSSCQSRTDANRVHLTGDTGGVVTSQKTIERITSVESIRQADIEQTTPSKNETDLDPTTPSKNDGLSALQVMEEEFKVALGDAKLVDFSDENIGSSIVALEEQISRIAWLKGVMRLGLKGWSKERRKRKWLFCSNTEENHVPRTIT